MNQNPERRGGDPAAPATPSEKAGPIWRQMLETVKRRVIATMDAEDVRRGDPVRSTVESMVEVPIAYAEAMAQLHAENQAHTEASTSKILAAAGSVQKTALGFRDTVAETLDKSVATHLPAVLKTEIAALDKQRSGRAERTSKALMALGIAGLLAVGSAVGWVARLATEAAGAATQMAMYGEAVERMNQYANAAEISAATSIAALSAERRFDALAFANLGTAASRQTLLAIGRAIDARNLGPMYAGERVPPGCLTNGPPMNVGTVVVARSCLMPLPPDYPALSDQNLARYYKGQP